MSKISAYSLTRKTQIFSDAEIQSLLGRRHSDVSKGISEKEVKEILLLSANASRLRLGNLQELVEESAALIMEELDPDNRGFIQPSELESLMRETLDGKSPAPGNLDVGTLEYCRRFQMQKSPFRRLKAFFYNVCVVNGHRIVFLLLWLAIIFGLFTWQFTRYRELPVFEVLGYCICTAKGTAEVLKFNMALILLPVSRNLITILRSTWLSRVVPFNDTVNFHKAIAAAIAVAVILHGGVHLTCDFPRVVHADHAKFEQAVGDAFHGKQPNYIWFLTSIEGVTGFSMVILMTISFTFATRGFRRSLIRVPWPFHRMTGFNAFWYTHHFFVVVYILLIVHGTTLIFYRGWRYQTTWMYISVPVLLYCGERIHRSFRSRQHTVVIVASKIYPGNVLALHMSKPPDFKFKSGMYMFLNCPKISPLEWHPFSISSAPGDEYLCVHIRALGDWTKAFHGLCQAVSEPSGSPFISRESCSNEQLPVTVPFPKLCIDGPYGDHENYDVLLFVGLGIGATPFISILKDMANTMTKNAEAPSDEYCTKPKSKHTFTNVYFYWVTREQGSFDWFRAVMQEVEQADKQQAIEMHNYLTSVYEEGDPLSVLMMVMQAVQFCKNGVDIVSESRVRTHFARPNWKKVFSRLSDKHAGKTVGVFYCGPLVLARELSQMS